MTATLTTAADQVFYFCTECVRYLSGEAHRTAHRQVLGHQAEVIVPDLSSPVVALDVLGSCARIPAEVVDPLVGHAATLNAGCAGDGPVTIVGVDHDADRDYDTAAELHWSLRANTWYVRVDDGAGTVWSVKARDLTLA